MTVRGFLPGARPGAAYTVELFTSPGVDASGHGEGKTPLGQVAVTTRPADGLVIFFTPQALRPLTPGHYVTATATDAAGNTSEFSAAVRVNNVGFRSPFYNNSAFDGRTPGPDPRDIDARAADKYALLPNQDATFANYTSYDKGLSGVMVLLTAAPAGATFTAADFDFRAGNDNNPAAWPAAPAPSGITAGPDGSVDDNTLLKLTWPDGAIKGKWLRVTVRANARTGLAADDVFYLGNAPGEGGDGAGAFAGIARVGPADELAARHHPRGPSDPARIDSRWDYNRDRLVNRADQLVARASRTTLATALRLITVPGARDGGAAAPAARRAAAPRLIDLFAGFAAPAGGGAAPGRDETDGPPA